MVTSRGTRFYVTSTDHRVAGASAYDTQRIIWEYEEGERDAFKHRCDSGDATGVTAVVRQRCYDCDSAVVRQRWCDNRVATAVVYIFLGFIVFVFQYPWTPVLSRSIQYK